MSSPAPVAALPPSSRLVHIGFPKTGTTTLQAALEAARRDLARHGVVYPGRERYHKRASVAVVGAKGRIGDPAPDRGAWDELRGEVERAGRNRVIVSSEWFCEADAAAVRETVDGLGGESAHVVATLRPLGRILASSWQQYVQNGVRTGYPAWLDGMLRKAPYDRPTPTFWRRHSHDKILERWADIVGPERVVAIVVDETDHEMLLRVFEQLVDVPTGTLALQRSRNSSLSWPQVELVRRLNQIYRERRWSDEFYRRVVRQGVSEFLAHETTGELRRPAIATPQWALDRASEIGTDMAAAIGRLGVTVVGDLQSLATRLEAPPDADPPPAATLGPELAGVALTGAAEAARELGRREGFDAALDEQGLARIAARRAVRILRARRR